MCTNPLEARLVGIRCKHPGKREHTEQALLLRRGENEETIVGII
jgi:hypothetical protein